MKHGERPATIYDVATLAGVSHQTVTRFLHGSGPVRETTAARVQQAIAELGYRPNFAARQLRSQRSNRIGVLTLSSPHYGPGNSLLREANRRARELGYFLHVEFLADDNERTLQEALDGMEQAHIDALLVTTYTDQMAATLSERKIVVPVVFGDDTTSTGSHASVDAQIGMTAANHLIALGHERLLAIAGPPSWLSTSLRLQGFQSEMEKTGRGTYLVEYGDGSPDRGYQLGTEFDPDSGITAVFAQNDRMALGFLAALNRRRIAVPGRVSVMGVDDMPETRFFAPALTSIRINYPALTRELIESIVARVEKLQAPTTDRQGWVSLYARASTARARPTRITQTSA